MFGVRRPLYLGSITVASSFSFKKGVAALNHKPIDPDLIERTLRDVMALPPASDRDPAASSDLAIDITVSDYDMGALMLFSYFGPPIPIAWRPEVTMTARVYEIDSDKTIFAHTVKQKLEWRMWLRKIRNPKALIGIDALMKPEDVGYLVRKTCVKLLKRVRKGI